ncbi:MAG: sigma-54-dependent Fis family transcriptional regulator [Acidobacteria bacterium]|nr:sigma-54-dependent Fis family transcriptional regulator [Acidobacteriota bacterium]
MTAKTDCILIVDDEVAVCELLSRLLRRQGFVCINATDGQQALSVITRESVDLMLLDIRMPGLDGFEVLERARIVDPDLRVVMVTADGHVPDVVTAMRHGAHDYVVKPFAHADVIQSVRKALSERDWRHHVRDVATHSTADSLEDMMGSSQAVKAISGDALRVARSDFTVLLLGETGTGKELVAHAIHHASARSRGPFVAVDCGAIPETLFESELFGHEKGAFTGADRAKPGKFELAADGTLFLDEIGNMPLGLQAKLLRALQERSVCRIGGTKRVPIHSRVLAAANEDLEVAVAKGTFRKDLFFRLNEFVIRIPPLRKRREDIVYLAKRFLDATNQELAKAVQGFSVRAVEQILAHAWPGNVRQLRSAVRRAVLLADATIEQEHLGLPTIERFSSAVGVQPESLPIGAVSLSQLVRQATGTLERAALVEALSRAGGNKAEAARLLHIDYKTMYSKLKGYGLCAASGEGHVQEKI